MFRKTPFLLLLLALWIPIHLFGFEFQNGDILFQDGNPSNFNDAIKDVTTSIAGYNFSHCGIVFIDDIGTTSVIEAIPDSGVVITPLVDFLLRHLNQSDNPKVVVGRINDSLQHIIPNAIQNALSYLGKDYDYEFDFENDKIYCSELIYFAFQHNNKPIFTANPMTFKEQTTNQAHPN
jgi:uncharacterized protein YycO